VAAPDRAQHKRTSQNSQVVSVLLTPVNVMTMSTIYVTILVHVWMPIWQVMSAVVLLWILMVAKTNKLAVVPAVLAQHKQTRLKTPLVLAHRMQANVMTIAKTSVMPMVSVLMLTNLQPLIAVWSQTLMVAKCNKHAQVVVALVLLKPTSLLTLHALARQMQVNAITMQMILATTTVHAKMVTSSLMYRAELL